MVLMPGCHDLGADGEAAKLIRFSHAHFEACCMCCRLPLQQPQRTPHSGNLKVLQAAAHHTANILDMCVLGCTQLDFWFAVNLWLCPGRAPYVCLSNA